MKKLLFVALLLAALGLLGACADPEPQMEGGDEIHLTGTVTALGEDKVTFAVADPENSPHFEPGDTLQLPREDLALCNPEEMPLLKEGDPIRLLYKRLTLPSTPYVVDWSLTTA